MSEGLSKIHELSKHDDLLKVLPVASMILLQNEKAASHLSFSDFELPSPFGKSSLMWGSRPTHKCESISAILASSFEKNDLELDMERGVWSITS